MKLRRSHRVFAALLALASLLFMQLAVAAYACPMQTQEKPAAMGMADCHGMERMNPNLCQAHSEAGKQSLDKAPTPAVQPFIAAAVLVEVSGLDRLMQPSAGIVPTSATSSGASPPISILHCCFRI
jgi:uncharacterized membrane protein